MVKSRFGTVVGRTALWAFACASLASLRVGSAAAASCTDGIDCYCDRVNDASLVLCEDFESRDYYENTAQDWVTPQSGWAGDRGLGSRWVSNYGSSGASYWTSGNPASPKVGSVCSPSGQVCGAKEYCSPSQSSLVLGFASNDCWDGNSGAAIDVQRAGDHRAEIGSLSLSGGSGTSADVGAGNQHMAFRIGAGNTAGIVGGRNWSSATEIGVTSLVAYSSNLASTGILNDYWKGHEWGTTDSIEWWTNGNMLNVGSAATFPFRNFFWQASGTGASACTTELRNSLLVGTGSCDGGKIYFGASNGTGVGQYNQATDWPFGTWGCIRAHMTGLGTADVEVRIWFNEELVLHIDGFDSTYMNNKHYDRFVWNHYSNANQAGGNGPTSATSFVYEDNFHIRRGTPVSCSAVGFGSAPAGTTTPTPTTGLLAPVLLP